MDVSPTLGITPINTAPINMFGAAAAQQLQQFGEQLRQDITTIQSNNQLHNMASQLQGIDPNTMNGDFADKMTQAVSQNPLGAHTPAGISILAQLGNAHQNYVQSTLLGAKLQNQANIAKGHDQTRLDVSDNTQAGANSRSDQRTQLGYDKLDQQDNVFNQTQDAKTRQAGIKTVGNSVIDLNQQDEDGNPKVLYTGTTKPVISHRSDGSTWNVADPDKPKQILAPLPKSDQPTPTAVFHTKAALDKAIVEAEAKNTGAEVIWKSKPDDADAKSAYTYTQSLVNGLKAQREKFNTPAPSPAGPGEPALSPSIISSLGTGAQPSGGANEITSKSQYDALPSGSEFVWNGKRGKKP